MADNEPADWDQLVFRAGQVFTPTAPIDEPALFSGRTDQIRLIVDVVNQRGQHAILYGEPGVGKTSLANVVSSFTGPSPVLATRVNCDDHDTFDTVWVKVFDKISEEMTLTQASPGIGFNAPPTEQGLPPSALLAEEASPDSVRKALTALGSVCMPIITIDEFDRLGADRRRAFADVVKTLSDHAVEATVVLVGVADSVEQLLAEHQSVERTLLQIRMPRMSDDEVSEIITKGLNSLGMSHTPEMLARIVRLSQGLPHYAHLLGLHATRAACDRRSSVVGLEDVDQAVKKATSGVQQSILSAYELAVRSARKDNLFADVLLACALADTTELGFFAAQDVRGPLQRVTGRDYQIPTFAKHLNEFADGKRGNILVKTGTPRLYRYRFHNPLMQPYAIMQGLKNERITLDNLG